MSGQIPQQVLDVYAQISRTFHRSKTWNELSEYELWRELCLCILSSNVPYELALSALHYLDRKGYLSVEWIDKTPESQTLIAAELSKPIFSPKKLDGSFRKYRFPNLRAKNIYQAAKVISSKKYRLSKLIKKAHSEKEARDLLVKLIPGFGMKEASHFLRNIQYSNRLAIIDSHVVSFLEEIKIISRENIRTITPIFYLELESRLQEICEEYGLDLPIFDMAVWHYMRRK